MVHVRIDRYKQHFLGFSASGHAGYAKRGKDIVCSSISVLTQTCLISLDEIAKCDPTFSMDEDSGDLQVECTLQKDVAKQTIIDTLIESMKLGIQAISDMYPEYVKLEVREVQLNDN